MRKNHYGNEAEAMKRAQMLMNEEEEEDENNFDPSLHNVPPLPNGHLTNSH